MKWLRKFWYDDTGPVRQTCSDELQYALYGEDNLDCKTGLPCEVWCLLSTRCSALKMEHTRGPTAAVNASAPTLPGLSGAAPNPGQMKNRVTGGSCSRDAPWASRGSSAPPDQLRRCSRTRVSPRTSSMQHVFSARRRRQLQPRMAVKARPALPPLASYRSRYTYRGLHSRPGFARKLPQLLHPSWVSATVALPSIARHSGDLSEVGK